MNKNVIFFLFTKLENMRVEQALPGRDGGGKVGTSGREEEVGKEHGRVNIVQILLHMYVNGKIRPVETILGMVGRFRRMVEGVNSSMINLIHCKNICKRHNVPHPEQ
jgi:hypothetical protein